MKELLDAARRFAHESGFNLIRFTVMEEPCRVSTAELVRVCRCLDLYSVAKVFTVTAVGLLCDDGRLDTNETLGDIFGRDIPCDANPAWRNVTVDQLLLHKAGYPSGHLDIDARSLHSFGTHDFLRYLLTADPVYIPGSDEAYSDAAFYMLSQIISRRAGEPMDDMLWRRLFMPLGIDEAAWSKCPMGCPMGATGLYMSSEDTAKLGYLYLNGGTWNGERIFSEKWADTVISRGYELKPAGRGSAYCKGGMYGQMLVVVPERRRVICWQAYDSGDNTPLLNIACS